MGLLSFLLFGLFGSEKPKDENPDEKKWTTFRNDYDSYYEELHDEAMMGDMAAREEMQDEFGDDWEDEY